MANILDALPRDVKVPPKFLRNFRLLELFVEGYRDGQKGECWHAFGDDFHRTQGRKAISAYSAGYEAGAAKQAEVESSTPAPP